MDYREQPDKVKGQKLVTRPLMLHSAVILIGTSFLIGWNFAALNQPSEHIKDFINDSYKDRYGKAPSDLVLIVLWSITNAIFFPAGMLGALMSTRISDRMGRKRAILISHIPTVIGAVMQVLCVPTNLPELLILGRLVIGIGCGLYSALAPTYITEIAPRHIRGAFGVLHQLTITVGLLVAPTVGLSSILGSSDLWQYILLLSIGPVLISSVFLPFFPESPRYLMLTKRDEQEARTALQYLRQYEDVAEEIKEMMNESRENNSDEKVTFTMLVKTPHLRKPLVVACLLQVIQQTTGITAITVYSVGIFTMAGVPESNIEYVVIGQNAVLIVSSIIGVILVDKIGRRPLLIVPFGILIVDLIVFTVALIFQDRENNLSYLIIASSIIFSATFALGPGPIPRMIGSELFRQGPRPIAMAVVSVTNWLSIFVVMISFELIRNALKEFTLLLFLFASMFAFFYIYLKVPETKHRTFEDIAKSFQNNSQDDNKENSQA